MKFLVAILIMAAVRAEEEVLVEERGNVYNAPGIAGEYPYAGANIVQCDYQTYNDHSKAFDCRDYKYPIGESKGRYCIQYDGYCCPYTGECYYGNNWTKAYVYCPYCNKCGCRFPGRPEVYHEASHQYAQYEPGYAQAHGMDMTYP